MSNILPYLFKELPELGSDLSVCKVPRDKEYILTFLKKIRQLANVKYNNK